jgi:uncharacterized protein (TIGR00162 family)
MVKGVPVMVCAIKLIEKPELRDPILIEGLPGIGLVANIAVAYLIRKLNARLFGEIKSASFPDVSITDKEGSLKSPFSGLYYYKGQGQDERNLILLYGNTQALTRRGQYELCGHILDIAESLGCQYVITLGGYRPGRQVTGPDLYYAASDLETAQLAGSLGAKVLGGQIFGVAGLLVGLAGLRGMKGFCLLAETAGNHPDREAAVAVLKAISGILGLKIDAQDLKKAEELTDFLSPFDFGALSQKPVKETKPDWFI